MIGFFCRVLFLLALANIVVAHYYWFEMPGTAKFSDGSDIPSYAYDEPLPMQKRFRIKYVRDLAKLDPNAHW